MFIVVFTGLVLVSVTVFIHAIGTVWWVRELSRRGRAAGGKSLSPLAVSPLAVLIQTAHVLVMLHAAEVLAWAVAWRALVPSMLTTFEEAVYFSFATFTTLGYGDVVISGRWRLLTGFESLNGVLLLGWSSALYFVMIQRLLAAGNHDRFEP
ncbi:MAG: potassium channel family protein [Acidobacteriota bacterium]